MFCFFFLIKVLCTYNGVQGDELSAKREDYLNVFAIDGPHYVAELDTKEGKFPIGKKSPIFFFLFALLFFLH